PCRSVALVSACTRARGTPARTWTPVSRFSPTPPRTRPGGRRSPPLETFLSRSSTPNGRRVHPAAVLLFGPRSEHPSSTEQHPSQTTHHALTTTTNLRGPTMITEPTLDDLPPALSAAAADWWAD